MLPGLRAAPSWPWSSPARLLVRLRQRDALLGLCCHHCHGRRHVRVGGCRLAETAGASGVAGMGVAAVPLCTDGAPSLVGARSFGDSSAPCSPSGESGLDRRAESCLDRREERHLGRTHPRTARRPATAASLANRASLFISRSIRPGVKFDEAPRGASAVARPSGLYAARRARHYQPAVRLRRSANGGRSRGETPSCSADGGGAICRGRAA